MSQSDYQQLFQNGSMPTPAAGYGPTSQLNVNPFYGGRMPFGLGSILTGVLGTKMWPLMNPGGQQSLYDAAWHRDRDMQMMGLAKNTVSSWYPFQNMGGLNPNSMVTQMASRMMSDPDGPAARFMNPILGGNPIAAQMSSFASLQGIGGSGLGTGRGVSGNQLTSALDAFNSFYYKHDSNTGTGMRSTSGDRAIVDAIKQGMKESAPEFSKAFAKEPSGSSMIQTTIRGMNFSNNLGLSVNTLLTARDEFVKNRMFSPTPGIPGLNKLSELAGGAEDGRLPALIAAAKGTFGNGLSDRELMRSTSDFQGNTSFNVANRADTDKFEKTLRMFKATARESNIDLNAMLGLNSQAQAMAGQSPNLDGLGGLEIANMVSNSAQKAAVMATSGSAESNKILRYQGGTAGLISGMVQNTLNAANNPTAVAAAAVRTYIKDSSINSSIKNNLLKNYDQWADGSHGASRNLAGLFNFMKTNFAGTGLSADRAFQYSYGNSIAAQQAYEDHPNLFSTLANGMQMDSINFRVRQKWGNAGVGRLQQYLKANKQEGIMTDTFLNADASSGESGISAMLKRAVKTGAFSEEIIRLNPELRQNNATEKEAIRVGSLMDTEIDRKMGAMRPDVLTRLSQSFASGDYSKKGVIEPFLKAIGVSATGISMSKMTDLTASLEKMTGAKTLNDVMANMGLSNDQLSIASHAAKLSKKYGIGAGEMQDIASTGNWRKIIQGSVAPKSIEEINDLMKTAKQYAGIGDLQGFTGAFETEGLKGFAKKGMTSKALHSIWDSMGISSDFGKMVKSELGVMRSGTETNKQLAKAVEGLSLTDGGTSDYLKGIHSISKMTSETITKNADGTASLPSSMQNFLNTFKDGSGRYKPGVLSPELIKKLNKAGTSGSFDKSTAQDIMGSVDSIVQNNPMLSGLTKQGAAVDSAQENFVGTKDGTKDLPTLVQEILNKIDGLSSISDAIGTLTTAVRGEAHP